MATKAETGRAESQAKATAQSIKRAMDALRLAEKTDGAVDCEGEQMNRGEIIERIHEEPLCIQIRDDWYTPGERELEAIEYQILLATGGPAVRLYGTLDAFGQPETADLQYQDWFTPWETLRDTTDEEDAAILDYAQMFYFGG